MVEFNVPKQAIEDISEPSAQPGASETPETTDFEVSNRVMRDLGALAGAASEAGELLADAEDDERALTAPTPLSVKEAERRRASRNFSFTDGETRAVFEQLSAAKKLKALGLRKKMIEKFSRDFEGGLVSERSIGLLQVKLSKDSADYYLAHLGEPLTDMLIISEYIWAGRTRLSDTFSSQSTQIRYFGKVLDVINLGSTPAFDPDILGRSGNTRGHDFWVKALPPLDDKEAWRRADKQWSPWAPTIKL